MKLSELVRILGEIAPLDLAASWDNVGLLVEPVRAVRVTRALLTIDLTEAVMAEAIAVKANVVVAYHPPIFGGLTRVTSDGVSGRIVREALAHHVAIYSPHTALDAVAGGVNDWLIQAFGRSTSRAIEAHAPRDADAQFKLVTFVPAKHVERVRDALAGAGVAGVIGEYSKCSYEIEGRGTFQGSDASNPTIGKAGEFERIEEVRLEMVCRGGTDLQRLGKVLAAAHPYETPAWDLYRLEPKPMNDAGQGRFATLARPTSVRSTVAKIKRHLGLRHVRVAVSNAHAAGRSIESVAVCAGAGGSVLSPVRADLYLTGEMRHHDVLAANARGTTVVLTDHTNCERGYLPVLQRALEQRSPGLDVVVSQRDADPLRIV